MDVDDAGQREGVRPPVVVHHGDALDVLTGIPDASVDAVVTDPPYGIGFMGKAWDGPGGMLGQMATGREKRGALAFQRWCELWAAECLRILKPGGHMLVFGGTRTWHRLTCAIEDVGFEVRDSIAWLYGSGFPKSLDVSKAIDKTTPAAQQWQGWGTALKPAFEPIVVARKPLAGTVAANVLTHGTGALNIDGCRVESGPGGRWPTNVVLDGDQADELDQQSGTRTSGTMRAGTRPKGKRNTYSHHAVNGYEIQRDTYADSGGASRFFPVFRYQPKAPTRERPKVDGVAHPTVKPLELLRWLVRLVTPPGGVVLDPFAGSGTTVEAAVLEGFDVIAVEREADYLPLIVVRMERAGLMERAG